MPGQHSSWPCQKTCSYRCVWFGLLLCAVLVFFVTLHVSPLSTSAVTVANSLAKEGVSKTVHSVLAKFTQTRGPSDTSPSLSDPREQTTAETGGLTEAEVASRFQRRRRVLRAACEKYKNSSFVFRSVGIGTLQISRHPPVMNLTVVYCPIAKVGSSTWKGVFKSISQALKARKIRAVPTQTPIAERDVLFTFVREPYSRLLSAYMDKLFSPNSAFWGRIGRFIVRRFRPNPSPLSLRCGHDVTFPEFVKYIIHAQTTGEKRDAHFIPVHDQCEMCKYPYTFIGHLETLREDMPYILKAIQSPVAYRRPFSNISIGSSAYMALHTLRRPIQRCVSLDEAARRVWKKFHTRGLVHKSLPFPFTREQTRDISVAELAEAGLRALALSGERSETKGQKWEAVGEAFSGVGMADRLSLQRLLMPDFDMFGFDPHPPQVFPPTPHPPDSDFSYFDLYK